MIATAGRGMPMDVYYLFMRRVVPVSRIDFKVKAQISSGPKNIVRTYPIHRTIGSEKRSFVRQNYRQVHHFIGVIPFDENSDPVKSKIFATSIFYLYVKVQKPGFRLARGGRS